MLLKNSFNHEHCHIIEQLLFWQQDLPSAKSLASELRRWHALWQQKSREDEVDIPNNLLLALGSCDVDSFPNIHSLWVIACTLPITEAERSFSLLRRMKTYTRSTLAEEHFSDLAVIAMHYSERIPVDEVCHAFIQSHPRRLFQASLFAD